jgi:tripartite-type tricarboxylate transporter receptor subunit TctC
MPSLSRLILAIFMAVFAFCAQAQSPLVASDGTIHIVVGYPPGGSSDRVARIVGDKLQAMLNMPVIVENKTGAGGRLAAQLVKAAPVGQIHLMLANPAVMVVAPLVFKDNGYDAERDFVAISEVQSYEFAMAIGPGVPARDLSELLTWLRANPEKANFGVPATGSLPHFFGLMMGDKANVKSQIIGYRGSAPLITDLIGGQFPVAFDTLDSVWPQHEAGKLRILAVSGDKRSPFAPAIPTFKEAGLDLVATGWSTFFAPITLPMEKAQRLSQAIRDVMQDPDTQRKFAEAKLTPVVSTQAQTQAMLTKFRAQWGPVVQRSGFQP